MSDAPTPLVSIVVATYNHAAYIEECLRSILMQRVDFPYEVLVGEDCSPDGTADVLRRLRPEFPESFTFVLRERNLGPVCNVEDLYARAQGKYLAYIEGDDFWTYDGKLQAQVDYLESHPECSAVYCRCVVVGKDSEPTGQPYPQCDHGTYSYRDYFYGILPGQTSTLVCRTASFVESRKQFIEIKQYSEYPGDRRTAFLCLMNGEVRIIQKVYSAYRYIVSEDSSSYSSTVRVDDTFAHNELLFTKTLVKYSMICKNRTATWFSKKLFYRTYFRWAIDKRSSISFQGLFSEIKNERRIDALCFLLSPFQWYFVFLFRTAKERIGVAVRRSYS